MALTTLDRNTALIVVDLQRGIAALPAAHPMPDIVRRASALARAFRRHACPVVLVTVAAGAPGRTQQPSRVRDMPAGWTDLLPELEQQPSDHTVTKRSWGAFTDTGLEQHLKQSGVTQVVVVGVATSIGVESTARQAHELGLNVTLATDAMTDTSPEAHANSVARIFPRLGETGTTQEVIAVLDQTRA